MPTAITLRHTMDSVSTTNTLLQFMEVFKTYSNRYPDLIPTTLLDERLSSNVSRLLRENFVPTPERYGHAEPISLMKLINTLICPIINKLLSEYTFFNVLETCAPSSVTEGEDRFVHFTLNSVQLDKIRKAAAFEFHRTGNIIFKYKMPLADRRLLIHAWRPTHMLFGLQVQITIPFHLYLTSTSYASGYSISLLEQLHHLEAELNKCKTMLELYESEQLDDKVVPEVPWDDFILVRQFDNTADILRYVGRDTNENPDG